MNIFKKIKKTFARLTDSGLSVTLELNSADLTAPINALITVETGKKSIHIKKIFLRIKSEEKISIPKEKLPVRMRRKMKQKFLEINTPQFTEKEFVVSQEEQKLEASQVYTWPAEIHINQEDLSSYNGIYAKHLWLLTAGLDTGKKDIQSDWENFHLK
ncbi:MAG: hypothetical protein CSB06_01210 [Bacteroidia bacterium]|nr:MAG: hypothetical protein CSB06_01210 [Bacteroidia bacterium]